MNQSPAITGNVDSASIARNPAGTSLQVTIQGWILHSQEEIVDIYFEAAGAARSHSTRVARSDIAQAYPAIPHAESSGYTTSFEFAGQELQTPLPVTLFATLRSGQKISSAIEIPLQLPKEALPPAEESSESRVRQVALRNFLSSSSLIVFPQPSSPRLSIIIVTFNRAHDTLACLTALQPQISSDTEIIVVDNNSSDQTHMLLNATRGLRIFNNHENLHFLRAARQGAEHARGDLLLFLNNDASVLPGGISAVFESFENHPNLGALGARLIHLNGSLQEVGGSVMPDGANIGNGVGEHPLAVPFLLQRRADYCSGAFLATPRELWNDIGGFDEQFNPAYYEDVDYCISVASRGYEVLVEPRITVLHAEGAVTYNTEQARRLMLENREKFRQKHADWLARVPAGDPRLRPLQPPEKAALNNILMIDDFFPLSSSGQGAPRARQIVEYLLARGCRVTFLALNEHQSPPPEPQSRLTCRVLRRGSSLLEFLSLNGASYGTIIVSRPHNMEDVQAIRTEYPIWAGNARIIYDAEAIFALREIRKQQLLHQARFTLDQIEKIVSQELIRIKQVDQIWAVSPVEAEEFTRRGIPQVKVISYGTEITTAESPLTQRSSILFVGPITAADSPNGEGFGWFKREVMPLIRAQGAMQHMSVIHAGTNHLPPDDSDPLIRSYGKTEDLLPLYQTARVFIAPVRFGSGIPLKVIDAAARGIPVVTTSYVASQLGWTESNELLVADDAAAFAKAISALFLDEDLWIGQHKKLLRRAEKDFSLAGFHATLRDALSLEP